MPKNILYRFMISLLDVIFPPVCQCCGKKLQEANLTLCNHCIENIPYTYYWNNPYNKLLSRLNRHAKIENALSLYHYKVGSGYDNLIHNFKYRNQRNTAFILGQWLGQRILESGEVSEYDYLLPIPLHPSRRRWRGYNQSLIIAQGISSVIGIEVRSDLLVRKRRSRQQSKIKDHKKRFLNMTDAFDITQAGLLSGRSVLVVDDVITSGATITSCVNAIHDNTKGCTVSVAAIASTEGEK